MEYMAIIKLLAPWVIAGATAFGGVKVELNGQQKKLNGVSHKLDAHVELYNRDTRTLVRTLGSMEAKVDLLIDDRIKR